MRDERLALVCGLFISSIFAAILSAVSTQANCRKMAIEAGIAEWRIDAKTGETEFHYLTPAAQREDER